MFDDDQNREYNTICREGTNTNRLLNTLIANWDVYCLLGVITAISGAVFAKNGDQGLEFIAFG